MNAVVHPPGPKRIVRPEVGRLELNCRRLVDPDATQLLVVCPATPGSESHEKLELLSVIGATPANRGTSWR
jgi:transcription regulator MmyB-like protein